MLAELGSLAESIELRVNLHLDEQRAIADNQLDLLRVVETFATPPTKQDEEKSLSEHVR